MTALSVNEIHDRLQKLGNKERAESSKWFFKTGPGEYGEGDIFLGLSAPQLRRLAKEYRHISISDALELLRSRFHEERALALLILIHIFSKANQQTKKEIYEAYLKHTRFINNWDLVDLSAPHIVGQFLMDKSRRPLYRLAKSNSLWERRISIIATLWFIRASDFSDTLGISELLLADKEDLIHKAVGWALREAGKRDLATEENFLREHYKSMPRTMLRYAIERFPEAKRQAYLKGKV
jgi:3-methyladenine DNA glycosylase AlkD